MNDTTVSIDFNAPPVLGEFLGDYSRVACIIGPVGSAKSSGCCLKIFLRAMETPAGIDGVRRSRCAVIRNTYPQLRDTTIKTFEEWVRPELGKWRASDHAFEMSFPLDDGTTVECEVLFRALDRPDDVRNLLSLELTFAYLNEAKEIEQAVLKMILTRINRYPSAKSLEPGVRYWSGVWMDTNAPDNDHWLYEKFEEEKPAGYALFRQPSGRSKYAENRGHWRVNAPGAADHNEFLGHFLDEKPEDPRAEWIWHLSPTYYEDLVAENESDPEFVKVYVDAEYGFPRDGKPVYPEYVDSLHCVDVKPNPAWPILLGYDFGLTPAAVLAQRDPSDGQIQIFDEMVGEDIGASSFFEELARYIKREYPGRDCKGTGDPAGDSRDPSDEQSCYDFVRAAGLPVVAAATNSFTPRREAVAHNLKRLTTRGRPALVISPKARQLRKAKQGGYCYRRKQISGRAAFHDTPDKNMYSHVADAEQYLCVGEGEDLRAVQGSEPARVAVRFRTKRAFGGRR